MLRVIVLEIVSLRRRCASGPTTRTALLLGSPASSIPAYRTGLIHYGIHAFIRSIAHCFVYQVGRTALPSKINPRTVLEARIRSHLNDQSSLLPYDRSLLP